MPTPIADQNATEDAAFSFQFAANTFADVDVGDTLTYSASGAPAWLTFNAATRTFSGTPANADVGSVTITVTADDGHGGTASDSFDIVVGNANDAPTVANAIADQNATEDAAFSFQFAANTFADVDVGDTLTYTASGTPAWLTFNAATRTFSGTPANADVGSVTITVTADDGHGGTASDSFDIVVGNANDAPTVANAIADQNATEDSAFSFVVPANTFADVDVGDTLTYSASGAPAWLTFNAATRTFSGTPLNADVGSVTITVTADDGHGGTASDSFDIVVGNANDAPTVANAIADQNATEDSAFSFVVPANTFADVDVGDTLTYTASGAPAWLTFNAATRTFSGTPLNADVGSVTITVTADDGHGGTASDSFDIVVGNANDAPTVANAIADQNATEDAAFSFQFAANTFADVDVGDTLTYSASGAPAWLTFNAATRTFSGTPLNADVGSVTITVTADDGHGGTASDSFDIVVGNANDAPTVANAIADQNATEDAAFSFQFAANTFADVDVGDTLTYSASGAPAWLTFNAATRTFSGTPANADVGNVTITVTADDGHGGTASDSFDIVVGNANDAPTVANAIADQNATEDSAFSFVVPANTFADVDVGDTLTYSASGAPVMADVQCRDPNLQRHAGQRRRRQRHHHRHRRRRSRRHGERQLRHRGGQRQRRADHQPCDPHRDRRRQRRAPDHPGATAGQRRATSTAARWSPAGWRSAPAPASWSNNGDGTWTYTPAANDDTAVSFSYTISDGAGGSVAGTASLDITPVNDNPVITSGAQSGTVQEDGGLDVSGQVTATDADGGAVAGYSGNATGIYGSFVVDAATGRWSYALDNAAWQSLAAGASYSEVFTVTVTDDAGAQASQDVLITIRGTNDAPTISSGVQSGQVDEDLTVRAVGQVRAGDVDDGASANYRGDARGTYGSFAVDATTGQWTYTLDNAAWQSLAAGERHTEVFSVTVSDEHGAQATQDVSISVTGTNDAPVVDRAWIALRQGESVTLSTLNIGATDADTSSAAWLYGVSDVSGGRFELAEAPGRAIGLFTHAELEQGRVRFVHDGSQAAPAFVVSVNDAGATSVPLVADVAFVASSAGVGEPLPIPGDTVGGDDGGVRVEEPRSVDKGLFGAVSEEELRQGESGVVPSADPKVPAAQFENMATAPSASNAKPSLPAARVVIQELGGRSAELEIEAGEHLDEYVLRLVSLRFEGAKVGGGQGFDLPVLEAEAVAQSDLAAHEFSVQATQMAGISLTAGAVWWALRISGLLSSLLASLPAWRQLDLLPILPDDDEDKRRWDREDDEEAVRDENAVREMMSVADAEGRNGRG